jgi:hypothetical protein
MAGRSREPLKPVPPRPSRGGEGEWYLIFRGEGIRVRSSPQLRKTLKALSRRQKLELALENSTIGVLVILSYRKEAVAVFVSHGGRTQIIALNSSRPRPLGSAGFLLPEGGKVQQPASRVVRRDEALDSLVYFYEHRAMLPRLKWYRLSMPPKK